MVGLALVPIPGIYQISYMGMVTGHCVIRYLRKLFNPLKIYWKTIYDSEKS